MNSLRANDLDAVQEDGEGCGFNYSPLGLKKNITITSGNRNRAEKQDFLISDNVID